MRRSRLEAADRELERRNRELRQLRSAESPATQVLEPEIELGAWIDAELSEVTTLEQLRLLAERIEPHRPQLALLSLALHVASRHQWEKWRAGGGADDPNQLAAMYRELTERDG